MFAKEKFGPKINWKIQGDVANFNATTSWEEVEKFRVKGEAVLAQPEKLINMIYELRTIYKLYTVILALYARRKHNIQTVYRL